MEVLSTADPKPHMLPHSRLRIPLALASASATLLVVAPSALAASADATLTGGSLSFPAPANLTFPAVTLDGTNKTTSQTQPFSVNDARGTGVGWNVTATSTTFTSGGNSLPTGATTIASAPSASCSGGATCVTATPTGITYPYTLPAAAVAPTATKLFNANVNTGLGSQTFTPNWTLSVPASALAGTYTSTWTFSIISGP